jgi:death-on-curing protein
MAGNHGFADGNKRTTLILLHALISNSGYRLVTANDEEVETVILSAASSETSVDDLMDWFRPRIVKV